MGKHPTGIVGSMVAILVHLVVSKAAGSLIPAGPRVLRSLLASAVLTARLLLARLATAGMDASLATRVLSSGGVWLPMACLVAHLFAPAR